MGKDTENLLADRLKDLLEGVFRDTEVFVEKFDPRELEFRSMNVNAYGDTAPEIERAALHEAREFFGEHVCLHVLPGWEAKRNAYYNDKGVLGGPPHPQAGKRYVAAEVTVVAHGRLRGRHRKGADDDRTRDANERAA